MPESRSRGRKKSHFIPVKTVWRWRALSRQSWSHNIAIHLQTQGEDLKTNQTKKKCATTWRRWKKRSYRTRERKWHPKCQRQSAILKTVCWINLYRFLKTVWFLQWNSRSTAFIKWRADKCKVKPVRFKKDKRVTDEAMDEVKKRFHRTSNRISIHRENYWNDLCQNFNSWYLSLVWLWITFSLFLDTYYYYYFFLQNKRFFKSFTRKSF